MILQAGYRANKYLLEAPKALYLNVWKPLRDQESCPIEDQCASATKMLSLDGRKVPTLENQYLYKLKRK